MPAPNDLPLEIDVATARNLLTSDPNAVLLDVREQSEYDLVHIPQATLVPMSQLRERADQLEAWRDRPIVVQCHHGGRSLRVTHWLRQQGFTRVQNMAGGIDAWSEQIDPSLPRY